MRRQRRIGGGRRKKAEIEARGKKVRGWMDGWMDGCMYVHIYLVAREEIRWTKYRLFATYYRSFLISTRRVINMEMVKANESEFHAVLPTQNVHDETKISGQRKREERKKKEGD